MYINLVIRINLENYCTIVFFLITWAPASCKRPAQGETVVYRYAEFGPILTASDGQVKAAK